MSLLKFWLITVTQTCLRVLPFPCRTGLIRIGDPGRKSPVFLTGNFQLTVERVRRALRGIDAYLLVANSRGVNVWCAAAGGHLTNHDVVSVLKTSGIDQLVDDRRVILPQLAATGIEGKVILRKSGWRVVWGPVDARSIAEFLATGGKKTARMQVARFAWPQRLEMAVAWAFPLSVLALLVSPFWPSGVLRLVGLVWTAAAVVFLGFPLYEARLRREADSGSAAANAGRWAPFLFLWALFVAGIVCHGVWMGTLDWQSLLEWSASSLVVLMILGVDVAGSTPVYKSGLLPERRLRITLDPARCRGIGFCEQVCPTNVFTVDPVRRQALLPRADHCVQCGACIVQCPFDALDFRSAAGQVVAPEIIRRFKLNLLGTRSVVTRSGEQG